MFEFDHLFICVAVGAPEAEALTAFGLTEGDANVHPGQGTACRRFFFHNGYLELLWVSDPAEAQSELTLPTQLWTRWSQRLQAASPFGICLRPSRAGVEAVPFPAWEYRPSYLPSTLMIHMGEAVPLAEPSWFYLMFGRRPDAAPQQPLKHAAGFQEITHVRLTGPFPRDPSEPSAICSRLETLTLARGTESFAEITFDQGKQQRRRDFRPVLPLLFQW